jgi:hypothetical protein
MTIKVTGSATYGRKKLDRMKIRKEIAQQIKEYIMERVNVRGQGANGKLKGYSTKPLRIHKPDAGQKPMQKPARGWASFHKGGYKQYRDEAGLISNKFVFSNKGAAWRDWMKATQEPDGPLRFGFSDSLNVMAADEAIENGREDMLDLNSIELNRFGQEYIELALRQIWTEERA